MSQKNLSCPVCLKKNICNNLTLRQINFTTAVYLCKDTSCPYPEGFDWIEVKRNLDDIFNEDFVENETESNNQQTDDFDEWLNEVFDSHCGVRNERDKEVHLVTLQNESGSVSKLPVQETMEDNDLTSTQTEKFEVNQSMNNLNVTVNEIFDYQFSDKRNTSSSSSTTDLMSDVFVPNQSVKKTTVTTKSAVINQQQIDTTIKEGKISRTTKRKVNNNRICTKIENIIDSIKEPTTKEELDLKNYLLQYIAKVPDKNTPIIKPISVVKPQVQNTNATCNVEGKRRKVLSISSCSSLFKTVDKGNTEEYNSEARTDIVNISQNQDNISITKTLILGDGKFENSKFQVINIKPQTSSNFKSQFSCLTEVLDE